MQANRFMQGANKLAPTTLRAAGTPIRASQTVPEVQVQTRPASLPIPPQPELKKSTLESLPTSISTPMPNSVGSAPVSLIARDSGIQWQAHKKLLPDLKYVLPHCPDFGRLLTVQTWQRTEHSMVSWKAAVEEEREEKIAKFVEWAKLVCAALEDEAYWAEFIDPTSGLAFYAQHNTNRLFVATDVGIQRLGYNVLDTGCCKVLVHPTYGAKAFPATLFTTAPEEVVAKCIKSVEMSLA